MNKPGATPLMRAKKLEKYLGVEEIYLKLEGTNPYGHKFDRVSEIIVKDALNHGKNGILVDGSDAYINSTIQFCEYNKLAVKIPVFKNERWKERVFDSKHLLDFRTNEAVSKYELIGSYCKDNNFYDASQHTTRHLSMISLQKIGEEIAEKLGDDISTVFAQLSYGYTVSSLYNGFLNKWVEGAINRYPQIYSCTIPTGNAIFNDYKKNMEVSTLEDYNVKVNRYTRNLFTGEGALLEDTLKAIRDTNGKIISVDENLLKESAQFLKKQESIILSIEEGYSFAGFYRLAKEGKLKNGKHIIVLNDGKSDLVLARVTGYGAYSKETIAKWIKEWLQSYSDSMVETEEAVEAAIKHGFLVLAFRNNIPQGVCAVVNLGFKDFIPTYHLAYIGTKEGNKGRGIASELIRYVIELTGGKLSLHVDLDNKRARRLYEKMGFKTSYYRMIYAEEQ